MISCLGIWCRSGVSLYTTIASCLGTRWHKVFLHILSSNLGSARAVSQDRHIFSARL